MTDELIALEITPPLALVTLNRPSALNALSPQLLAALADALEALDRDPELRVIILTGAGRAFAAGADIAVLAPASPMEIIELDTRSYWERFRRISKPLIAAVNGYAYGGGCELAMTCDMIVASETAAFAQPEIKLGIMPGAGGTQRLTRAIGPYRAMELILTGEPLSAREAYASGLVNRLVPAERLLDEARELAQLIASRPPVAVRLAREAVRHGLENTVREGLEVERRNFLLLFDTPEQKQKMAEFLKK
jgi:enoyl-CoA hydratase